MVYETTSFYEVIAYKAGDDMPYYMEKRRTRITAERLAASWAKKFARVECNIVYADINDENNLLGDNLLVAYENGVKTTK